MFNVEQNIKLFQQGSYQEQIQTIEKLAVSSDTSELDDFQSLLLYVRENEDYTLILNMYRVFAERADQINMETSKWDIKKIEAWLSQIQKIREQEAAERDR